MQDVGEWRAAPPRRRETGAAAAAPANRRAKEENPAVGLINRDAALLWNAAVVKIGAAAAVSSAKGEPAGNRPMLTKCRVPLAMLNEV